MKQILQICAVLLLAQCFRADDFIEQQCDLERQAQLDRSNDCSSSLPDVDELLSEINTTLSRSDNDPSLIKWFANKVCSIAERGLTCSELETEFSTQCLSVYQVFVTSTQLKMNASRAVVNYMCKYDGEVFVDLGQDDGNKVFLELGQCFPKRAVAFNDSYYQTFRMNYAFCELIQEFFVCAANLVNNHPNPNLRRVVREVYDVLMGELPC